MRTRVYITCDVECAEERVDGAGRVTPAIGYDLRMRGRFVGRARGLGLDFMLDELDRAGLPATFFVEMLGAGHFGEDGLRDVCTELRDRGHDVQLHLHPVLADPLWHSRGRELVSDDIGDYPVADQERMLRDGIAIMVRCGVPAGDILAFRAGNFGAANSTWDAMRAAGLRLSSSYNPYYFGSSCKLSCPRVEQTLFDTGRGVWELPVTNFAEPHGATRHLQIAAVSVDELISVLEQAHRQGVSHVTIVTHPFEFFYVDSIAERRGRPNRINLRRFRGMCRYLAAHPHLFAIDTVGALAARLPDQAPSPRPAMLRGSRRHYVRRLVEQTAKRVDQRLGGMLEAWRSQRVD